MATRFDGKVGGLEFAVDWLNRFWPEAYDLTFLYAGNLYCAAAGKLRYTRLSLPARSAVSLSVSH